MGQPSIESKMRWLEANKHKRHTINRSNKLRNFFGISLEDYQKMLELQDYKCAICKTKLGDRTIDRHLDHDHSSGWVRGILCQGCNHGLGHFKEDIVRMQEAVEYLISNATPTEFNINEARARLRMTSKGNTLPRTDLQKKILSELRTGIPAWNKGKPWNEEVCSKMSVAAKLRWENATEKQKAPLLANLSAGRTSEAAKKKWETRRAK